jgi:hypothetical protein
MSYLISQESARTIVSSGIPFAAGAATSDVGIINIPEIVPPWSPTGIGLYSLSAAGVFSDLAFDIRTAAAGGGARINAIGAGSTSSMVTTGENKFIGITQVAAARWNTGLYVRMTNPPTANCTLGFTLYLDKVA